MPIPAHYYSHGIFIHMTQVSSKPAAGQASRESKPANGFNRLGLKALERVGNTPLLRLDVVDGLPEVEILGKAEWYNPGGSVKDRAASNIVAQARASGKFGPGKTLLDSTSGNTGIAYAMKESVAAGLTLV